MFDSRVSTQESLHERRSRRRPSSKFQHTQGQLLCHLRGSGASPAAALGCKQPTGAATLLYRIPRDLRHVIWGESLVHSGAYCTSQSVAEITWVCHLGVTLGCDTWV